MNKTAELLKEKGFDPENGPICSACGNSSRLTPVWMIYPNAGGSSNLWVCNSFPDCTALVGCHRKDKWRDYPLGSLATEPLRELRKKAHFYLDYLWKKGTITRKEAYDWLQKEMKLSPEDAHIGEFNEEQCNQLINICMGFD